MAELMILGYEAADLEDESSHAATPTPTRRYQAVLSAGKAHHNVELHKADVSRAFLQDGTEKADRFVGPTDGRADRLVSSWHVPSPYW